MSNLKEDQNSPTMFCSFKNIFSNFNICVSSVHVLEGATSSQLYVFELLAKAKGGMKIDIEICEDLVKTGLWKRRPFIQFYTMNFFSYLHLVHLPQFYVPPGSGQHITDESQDRR